MEKEPELSTSNRDVVREAVSHPYSSKVEGTIHDEEIQEGIAYLFQKYDAVLKKLSE